MSKLINKLSLSEFYEAFNNDYIDDLEDECQCQTKLEIVYRPIVNRLGDVVAILEVYKKTCMDCGEVEETVNEIFTNGDEVLEIMALDMGYREESEDE